VTQNRCPARQGTKMHFFRSIRWRLVASFAFLAVITVSAVGVLVLQITGDSIRGSTLDNLRANAQTIAQEAQPMMEPVPNRPVLDQLVKTAAFLGDVRVRLFNAQGVLLADSSLPGVSGEAFFMVSPQHEKVFIDPHLLLIQGRTGPGMGEIPSAVWDSLPEETSVTVVQRNWSIWGSRIMFASVPKPEGLGPTPAPDEDPVVPQGAAYHVQEPVGGAEHPLGYVELTGGVDTSQEALSVVRRALLGAGAGAVALAVVIGLLFSSRLTSPLLALQRTAEQMGAGDLSVRAEIQRPDEIGDLAVHFNQMAGQLEASFRQVASERDSLRRFIADASHELRNPVTALKNFVALLQGPAANDPPAQDEFLAESQVQVERLEWITSNLLNLTRLDAGLVEFELREYDLREILERAAAGFTTRLETKQLGLVRSLPELPVLQVCDPVRLEMAVSNLVDNAVKYTSGGGQITLGTALLDDQVTLWVQDTGTGILPEDLPHIFDRFYRGRGHAVPGSGLGLAIVKSLVEAQGGTISVESVPGEGTVFTITFHAG